MFTRTLPTRELVQENNFAPATGRTDASAARSPDGALAKSGTNVAPDPDFAALHPGYDVERALLVARHRGQLGHVLQ